MKLIKRIKAYFSLYYKLLLIKKYIPNGFYSVKNNCFTKKIVSPPIFIFSFKKKNILLNHLSIKFIETKFTKKITFVSTNFVLSYFKDKKKFLKSIDNYGKYSNILSYKINEIIDIDYKNRIFVTKFINGVEGNITNKIKILLEWNNLTKERVVDRFYNNEIKTAFECLKVNNVVSYVQHGDFRTANSLFQIDSNNLICIDCDDIGYYPALFDYFWLIAWHPNLFKDFLNGEFDGLIKPILGVSQLTLKDKDKYLSVYIICAKYFGMGHHLLPELLSLIPDKYILSKKALKYISSN